MPDINILRASKTELEALFVAKQDAAENFAVAIKEVATKADVSKKALAAYIRASVRGLEERESLRDVSTETVDLIELLDD